MLAELAAANAAFQVVKQFVQNGKELSDCASQIASYVNATEDLRRKAEKKKRSPFASGDLEEFMHLEKLKRQEEELKQLMIWHGRPNLWTDWLNYQIVARKERQAAIAARRKRNKQIMEIIIITVLIIAGFVGLAMLLWWVLYLKGL
jgi:hypothetical protein